jgi:hypothetical protein
LWAVLAGGSVSWLLKARPKSTPAIKPVMQEKLSLWQKTMAACVQAAIFIGRTG